MLSIDNKIIFPTKIISLAIFGSLMLCLVLENTMERKKNGKENYVLKFWMTWKIRGGKYKGKW